MTTKQLVKGWLTTIILGSAILPITLKAYEWMQNRPFEFESTEFLSYLMIGIALSALSSIPAMISISAINKRWINHIEPFQKRMRISAATSGVLIIATIIIVFLISGNSILEAIPMFLSYALPSIGFHLYQYQKSYHKPQVLNFPG
jgi:hypothetical protein